MARETSSMKGGARVPGNLLGTSKETARYPTSTATHEKGTTFGEYGSHATPSRPAMNVITIETFDNYTYTDLKNPKKSKERRIELESLATVLCDIFLGPP